MDFWNDGTNSWCSACFENWTLPFFLKLKDFMAMWELGQQHGFPVESLKFWLNGIWPLRDLSFVIAYYNHLCDSVRKALIFLDASSAIHISLQLPGCTLLDSLFLTSTCVECKSYSVLSLERVVATNHLFEEFFLIKKIVVVKFSESKNCQVLFLLKRIYFFVI